MEIFYHGTIQPFADNIIKTGYFNPSDGEEHLLGKGVYLYSDPFQADKWAKMKAKHLNEEPRVLVVHVEKKYDEYMDLDLRQDQNLFFQKRKSFFEALKKQRFEVDYYTDSHFCDFLSSLFSVNIMSKTFVHINKHESPVPVKLTNQKATDRDITRHYRTEKQYCIKEHSLIIDISEWGGEKDE